MNTNDLPPAAKLAALIEAGRAANPDLKQNHDTGIALEEGGTCALGFACLASGISREVLGGGFFLTTEAVRHLELADALAEGVYRANDQGASLAENCLSLRE